MCKCDHGVGELEISAMILVGVSGLACICIGWALWAAYSAGFGIPFLVFGFYLGHRADIRHQTILKKLGHL